MNNNVPRSIYGERATNDLVKFRNIMASRYYSELPHDHQLAFSLETSATEGNLETLQKTICTEGCNLNVLSVYGETPLMCAVKFCKTTKMTAIIKTLLEAGADPSCADYLNETALSYLLVREDMDNVLQVLNYLNDPYHVLFRLILSSPELQFEDELSSYLNNMPLNEYRDEDGHNLLHIAAATGRLDAVQYFYNRGCKMFERTKDKYLTPFLAAADSSRFQFKHRVLSFFIDKRVNILEMNNEGKTALHFSAMRPIGDVWSIGLLIDFCAPINLQDSDGNTALHLAARRGNSSVIRELVKRGADLTVTNRKGNTPLHEAVLSFDTYRSNYTMYSNILEFLLKNGASPRKANRHGKTPFHEVLKVGDLDTIKLFLRSGADPLQTTNTDQTSLHFAAKNGNRKVLVFLVQQYFSETEEMLFKALNTATTQGTTPLHVATLECHDQNIEYLFLKGANVNAEDINNNTPLLLLLTTMQAEIGSLRLFLLPEIIEMLMDRRANPSLTNLLGQSVAGVIEALNMEQVTKTFVKYVAIRIMGGDNVADDIMDFIKRKEYGYYGRCVAELNKFWEVELVFNWTAFHTMYCSRQRLFSRVNGTGGFAVEDVRDLIDENPIYGELLKERINSERCNGEWMARPPSYLAHFYLLPRQVYRETA